MRNVFNVFSIIIKGVTLSSLILLSMAASADALPEPIEQIDGLGMEDVSFSWSPTLEAEFDNSLIPLIFIDPSCSACKAMMPFLKQYPEDSYRIILVIQSIPSEHSFNNMLWHFSEGAKIQTEENGCQSACSSISNIGIDHSFEPDSLNEKIRRLTRAMINTNKWKELGGDKVATPSALLGGQYTLIESPEDLALLLGKNND